MKKYSHLFEELDSYSKKFLESQLSKWQAEQTSQYENFGSIFKSAIETIDKTNPKNPHNFWIELGITYKQLNEWVITLSSNANDIAATFENWNVQTQHFVNSFPPSIEEEIKDDFWIKNSKDTFLIKTWKFTNRLKNNVKGAINLSGNVIRNIFKKPPVAKAQQSKSIKTQDFFDYHFTRPFLSSIYDIWQNHLHLISRHLAEIHKETEQIVHPLFSDGKFNELLNSDNTALTKLQKHLINFDQIINDFLERYNVFKKGTLSSHKQFLSYLKGEIDNKWKYAGTYILPARKFNAKKFKSAFNKFEKQCREYNSDWQKHLDGEKTDWQKDNELSFMQLYSGQLCHKTISSIKKKIESLLPAFVEPRRLIENALRDLKADSLETDEKLKENILTIERTVLRDLNREKLPFLADAIVNARFEKTMESYLSQMENELESLSEEYTIFRHQDLNGTPPDSKFIDIPLKDIITEEIFSVTKLSLKPEIVNLSDTINLLIRSVSENDQIIELNFDTALELLDSDEENPLSKAIDVATQGLERSAKQLNDLTEVSKSIVQKTIDCLITETLHFEEQVQNLSENDKIIALKIRAEKAKTKDKIKESVVIVFTKIKRFLPELVNLLFNNFKKVQHIYYRLRKITGLDHVSADVEDQLSQFLSQFKKQLKSLPFVYQRLFRFQPLEDERFFAGRENEMTQLKLQLEHWKNGNFALTALIGEKGSGRTTILNFVKKTYYGNLNLVEIDLTHTIYREYELSKVICSTFKLDQCNNINEIEQALLNRETGCVCIVENLHNMFLRVSDGFEAIEHFLLLISNTTHKVNWIITCGLYSWQYLDKVLDIQNFFQKSIFLPELSKDDIMQLILKRHRVSGYKLLFEIPAELEQSRKFKKLASEQDQQNYLNELYFEKLSKLSTGNITVAFLFWLSSITGIKDDYLTISPVVEFETLLTRNMIGDDLFTFAAFIQHETLTVEQHALIFNQDLQKSLLLFNRLKNKGMLSENKNGYQVHYLLYKAVVRALKINNLLL